MPKIRVNYNSIDNQNTTSAIKQSKFICPRCGTYFIARDLGFIPNCNNCGSVMRKE